MRRARLALLIAVAALAATAISPAPAPAAVPVCGPGTAAGACANPEGIGADPDEDLLFVAERDNHRVSVFRASDQEFLRAFGWGVLDGSEELQVCTAGTGCLKGVSGSGAGQLSGPRWLAVDTVSAGEAAGDVYLTDHNRVNRFEADGTFVEAFGWGVLDGSAELQSCTGETGCLDGLAGLGECQLGGNRQPVAVGPEGRVFVVSTTEVASNDFTNRVMSFTPDGECLGQTTLIGGNRRVTSLAVDAAEDAFVAIERDGGQLYKYDLAVDEEVLCAMDPGIETNSLTIDGAGRLLAGQREPDDSSLPGGAHQVITEYETACPPSEHVSRFGYRQIADNLNGLAALPSVAGEVFGAEQAGVLYLAKPPAGPLIARLYEAFEIGNVRARVAVEANSEGEESEVEVQYVDDESFAEDVEDGGNGFEGAGVESVEAPVPFEAGKEFRARAVEPLLGCEVASEEAIEEGECLTPSTVYHWRARATNPSGEGEGWELGESFETEPPIAIEVFSSDVSTDTAEINAVVNPLGVPASGYFQYVEQSTFEQSGFDQATEVPAVEFEFGDGEEAARRSATLYPLKAGTTYRYRLIAANPFFGGIEGEEKTFTTHSDPGQSACPNDADRRGAAGLLPDCRAYELVSPTDTEGGDIIALLEGLTRERAVLEQSSVSGDRLAYGSYRAFGDAASAPYTSQYVARRVPGQAWLSHAINPPEGELIKSKIELDNEYRAFSGDLCEGWLVPPTEPPLAEGAVPDLLNLYRRTDQLCGGAPDFEAISAAEPEAAGPDDYRVEPQGSSADGSITAFAANDALEDSGAPGGGIRQRLYVKAPRTGPVFACVLPEGGGPSSKACSAGTGASGGFGKTRLANVTGALSEDGSRLYWSENFGSGALYLRENPLGEGGECSGPAAPCTVEVAPEGASFWAAATDGSAAYYTTGNLNGGSATLHRYEAESGESEVVAEEVFGFMGASEDASVAYLASGEAIEGSGQNSEGDEAAAGEPNLYRYEAGSGEFDFVATLAAADVAENTANEASSATAREPVKRSSRVSADGGSAAFMSAAPGLTGADNTDASSLAPCGAEGGICDTEAYLHDAASGELLCASCDPSGARPEGEDVNPEGAAFWVAARIPAWETTLYAPRALAEDGSRLYFESRAALVARDTNKRFDVYQWERAGKGTCSATSPSYSPVSGGCVDLISSGQSARDARLIDASPDGRDVFFATLRSLLPQDPDLVDVYDARAGGGLPTPAAPAAECEGESCQSPPPAPPFGYPGSSTFFGPGDLARAPARNRCARPARAARRASRRAKATRRSARRAARRGNPRAARRKASAAKRSARQARRLSRNAKRCRARARAARRSPR